MMRVHRDDALFAAHFAGRLRLAAPEFVDVVGNLALLSHPLTAFFCSAKCPGATILKAYDSATRWRDAGRAVVSGFHSPVERDCLRILLKGTQPVVVCPARTLDGMRRHAEWQVALDAGRLLLLSPFPANAHRTSARLARLRNEFVAALADEVVFPHVAPGGHAESLRAVVVAAGKPVQTLVE